METNFLSLNPTVDAIKTLAKLMRTEWSSTNTGAVPQEPADMYFSEAGGLVGNKLVPAKSVQPPSYSEVMGDSELKELQPPITQSATQPHVIDIPAFNERLQSSQNSLKTSESSQSRLKPKGGFTAKNQFFIFIHATVYIFFIVTLYLFFTL